MSATTEMRLLIANPSPDVYGSDLQMLETVSAMVARGWQVTIAIPQDGDLVRRIRERGAEVQFVSFPVLRRANASWSAFVRMVWSAAVSIPRCYRMIRSLRPAVVYVNTVTLPWWLLAARLARVPAVCHLHEAETQDRPLVRKALIMPLRLAAAVIVISRSTLSAMSESDPALTKKARLIYNGVPAPTQEPQPARREEPYRLIVVGRLSPRKAPHLALEAVAQLRRAGYAVRLELAGTAFDGYEWYVDQLRSRADQDDLAGAVDFSGYCSPIWPALARSDLMIAPSLREPFGNAVVEAQLSLRPVVATAALGHLESITDGETGLLVATGDVGAMADAIKRLIDDPELAALLATNAQREASKRFSTERYDGEIGNLMDELGQPQRRVAM